MGKSHQESEKSRKVSKLQDDIEYLEARLKRIQEEIEECEEELKELQTS